MIKSKERLAPVRYWGLVPQFYLDLNDEPKSEMALKIKRKVTNRE